MAEVTYYSFHGAFGSDLFDISTAHYVGGDFRFGYYGDNFGHRIAFASGGSDPTIQFFSVTTGNEAAVRTDFLNIRLDVNSPSVVGALWDGFIQYGVEGEISRILNGADAIYGSKSGDILAGYAGNDTLMGKGGDDTISGGAGNDILEFGPGGSGILSGGDGIDFFSVDGSDGNYNVVPTVASISDLGLGGVDIIHVGLGATVNATLAAGWTATVDTNNWFGLNNRIIQSWQVSAPILSCKLPTGLLR